MSRAHRRRILKRAQPAIEYRRRHHGRLPICRVGPGGIVFSQPLSNRIARLIVASGGYFLTLRSKSGDAGWTTRRKQVYLVSDCIEIAGEHPVYIAQAQIEIGVGRYPVAYTP